MPLRTPPKIAGPNKTLPVSPKVAKRAGQICIDAVTPTGGHASFWAWRRWTVDDVKGELQEIYGVRRDRICFSYRGTLCRRNVKLRDYGFKDNSAIFVYFLVVSSPWGLAPPRPAGQPRQWPGVHLWPGHRADTVPPHLFPHLVVYGIFYARNPDHAPLTHAGCGYE